MPLGQGAFYYVQKSLLFCACSEQALFLEGADSLCANLKRDWFPINHDRFSLEVWLPNFLGMALGKANVTAVLLAFAGDIAFLHGESFDATFD